MNDANFLGSFFNVDVSLSESTEPDSNYVVETFTIEYPESSGRDAKIYANGKNSVHVRINIGGLKKNGVPVSKEEIQNHIFLYDSTSKKLIPTFAGKADQSFTLPETFKKSPLISQTVVSFREPGAYSLARYPSFAASEAQLASASSNVITLDYYVRSLSESHDPIYLSLSGYYYTKPKTLPGADSTTTSNNNIPPLKLTIEPMINYREPAGWHVESAEPVALSTPHMTVKGINRDNIHLSYQRHTLIYAKAAQSTSGNELRLKAHVKSELGNSHALKVGPPSAMNKCGYAEVDDVNKKYSQEALWFMPMSAEKPHVTGGSVLAGFHKPDNITRIVTLEGNIEFGGFAPSSEYGMTFICVKIRVNNETNLQISDGKTINYPETIIILQDRFGHQQEVNVAFNVDNGVPSVS